MSVAHLGLQEFATFTAIASARLQLGTLGEIAAAAELMSRSNCAAYTGQYGDIAQPCLADDIEAEALRLLAADDLLGHFGPIIYNCVTNGGTFYYGDLPADATQTTIANDVAHWRKLEDEARKWQDGLRRKFERAEQNAVAFDTVSRLPLVARDKLQQAIGEGALIVAYFRVDESESQSDYWGGRTARAVVIGLRKGKRESFPALRKAAAKFPPTAGMAPGHDIYTARVVFTNDCSGNGTHYWKGCRSHWHQELGSGSQFSTRAQAERFIAQVGPPHSVGLWDGVRGEFAWDISCESFEHRENYSMGGGNYLGTSRYGGWVVKSSTSPSEAMEVFSLK